MFFESSASDTSRVRATSINWSTRLLVWTFLAGDISLDVKGQRWSQNWASFSVSVARRENFNPNWLKQESWLFQISEQFGRFPVSGIVWSRPQAMQLFLFLHCSAMVLQWHFLSVLGRLITCTQKMAPRISQHSTLVSLFSVAKVRPFYRISSKSLTASQWLKLATLSQYPGPGGMWGSGRQTWITWPGCCQRESQCYWSPGTDMEKRWYPKRHWYVGTICKVDT